MSAIECTREGDVIDAVRTGRWPGRADNELRAHVAACEVCADVAEVAAAMNVEHDMVWAEAAALPSASVVWLRAQARARAEASREAARPIAVMQAMAFACAAALMSAVIGAIAYWVWVRADWLRALPVMPVDPIGLDAMNFAIRGTLLAVAVWLVLAPVAVYLAAYDD